MKIKGLTAKEIARLWGVSNVAVGLWVNRDKCPRNKNGTYDLARVIKWRETHIREQLPKKMHSNSSLERLRANSADMKEFELAKLREKVMDVRTVKDREDRLGEIFKTGLVSMPRRMATTLFGRKKAEIEHLLRQECDEVLAQVCKELSP